jgi:hypothetical protein
MTAAGRSPSLSPVSAPAGPTSSRSQRPVHAHYFRPPRGGGRPPFLADKPLLWRLAAIAAIPLAAWAATGALHQRIPQTAADVHYDVVINRLTGHACIEVKGRETPGSLADLACE